MNPITEYQQGIKYPEDVKNAVLYGYLYRKEAEKKEDNSLHYCLGTPSELLLWLGKQIISGVAWDSIKYTAKELYKKVIKEGLHIDGESLLVLKEEKQLKEFYQDIKEFNEQRMAITDEQFQYIREEIIANTLGEETQKTIEQKKRIPTTSEYIEINRKANKKADEILGCKPNSK